jgi:hypothetical protein
MPSHFVLEPLDARRAFGDTLSVVNARLGCPPSTSHRKGDRAGRPSPPSRTGAWLLRVEVKSPEGPDEALRRLLMRLPNDPLWWRDLREQYEIQLWLGIFTKAWNRGFDLTPATIAMIHSTGSALMFDLYVEPEDT